MPSSSPVERIAASPLITITGIVADVSAVVALILSDDLRNWVKQHPLLLFGVAAALLAVLVLLINRMAAKMRSLRQKLSGAEDQIEDLERRLNPTKRDMEMFTELLNLFPWNTGLIPFFQGSFNGKMWFGQDVDALYRFCSSWEERYFDDPEVQEAYSKFYESCNELSNWLAGEGSPDLKPTPDGEYVYRINDGSVREGGWPELNKVRKQILDAAYAVCDERRDIEKVGRERGL